MKSHEAQRDSRRQESEKPFPRKRKTRFTLKVQKFMTAAGNHGETIDRTMREKRLRTPCVRINQDRNRNAAKNERRNPRKPRRCVAGETVRDVLKRGGKNQHRRQNPTFFKARTAGNKDANERQSAVETAKHLIDFCVF